MCIEIDTTCRIKGGRVGVLLIHGLYGNPGELRFVAESLGAAGYSVSCPMLDGHGGASADRNASTWRDWLGAASAALDELRKDCDLVYCGGLSTGAALSLMLAAEQPGKVQGTVLLSPTLWRNGRLTPWYEMVSALLARTLSPGPNRSTGRERGGFGGGIAGFFRKVLSGVAHPSGAAGAAGTAAAEHRRLVEELRGKVGGIAQPALIVHPRDDAEADLANAWYLQRNLKGLVDMVMLDERCGCQCADVRRQVLAGHVLGFLDRLSAGRKGKVEAGAASAA